MIAIEFHYPTECWFISSIENEKYADLAYAEDHPNEIVGDDLSGDWPVGTGGSEVVDYLVCRATGSDKTSRSTIVVRGLHYEVCSFAAFHFGFEIVRFRLALIAEAGGAQ
jgi:hypothetical protein